MTTKKYFSQFQEDRYLSRIFTKNKGLCIEIGGFDGVTGSTTYFFELKGWDCIVVEPIPALYRQILKNRNCKVLNYAITDEITEIDFFIASGVEMLSSIAPDKERIQFQRGEIQKIRVKTRTLDSILEDNNVTRIDFISIDVEGHELNVLKGFSILKYEPEIVIVENNNLGIDSEIKRYLKQFGYVIFKITGCNEWYTHRSNKLNTTMNRLHAYSLVSYNTVIKKLKRLGKRVLPISVIKYLLNNNK